jgi:ABC-type Na+ efflux pump permease subunit
MLGALGPLLASFLAVDVSSMKRRLRRNAILYGIASAFFLTAYVLLVTALALYLGERWGLPIALLAVAGGMIVLALIMIGAAAIANSIEEKRRREAAQAASSQAMMVTAALSVVPAVIKSKPLMAVSIAAGLGFLLMKGVGRSSDK